MKVLFAIRDENNIVGSIVRKYQQDYKEKLIYKEVKNFTAILKELQQNNDYDRIIISDDIDTKINQSENRLKLILNNLNKINKLTTSKNKISPIIFIGNDVRILKYLFEMNIFNAIIGKEKSKKKIYELIQNPRNKKEARTYYIDKIKSNENIKSDLNNKKEPVQVKDVVE